VGGGGERVSVRGYCGRYLRVGAGQEPGQQAALCPLEGMGQGGEGRKGLGNALSGGNQPGVLQHEVEDCRWDTQVCCSWSMGGKIVLTAAQKRGGAGRFRVLQDWQAAATV